MSLAALSTSTIVVPVIVAVLNAEFDIHAGRAVWVAGIWLTLAAIHNSAALFTAFQAMATLGLGFAVTAICQRQSWWGVSAGRVSYST